MSIIEFCEKHLEKDAADFAKDYFCDASTDSMSSLRYLCGRSEQLKVSVVKHVIILERIKSGNIKKQTKEIKKIRKKRRTAFLKSYAETVNKAMLLNPPKSNQIKKRFSDFLSGIEKTLFEIPATEPLRMGFTYNFVMQDLVELLRANTSHTDNAIYNYLCDLLNNLGCTSPQNKSFNRQIIRSLISY